MLEWEDAEVVDDGLALFVLADAVEVVVVDVDGLVELLVALDVGDVVAPLVLELVAAHPRAVGHVQRGRVEPGGRKTCLIMNLLNNWLSYSLLAMR